MLTTWHGCCAFSSAGAWPSGVICYFWNGFSTKSSDLLVQGQVESQHIDPRFTEDSEVATLGVRTDDFFQCLSADTPCRRHAPRLQESILKADVRVQAAARCRH